MTEQRTAIRLRLGRVAVGLMAITTALLLMAPVATATPETDATDAINAAYDASGGPTGPLGAKTGEVYPVGTGFGQDYASGKIFFAPDAGAHLMQGAILDKYEALGGPGGSDLGFPNIDEGAGKAADSRNTTFSGADKPVIFWTPSTGAFVVRGAINAAWDQLGGSAGTLGVPTEDEQYSGDVISQKFTGGEVSWNRVTKTFTTVPPDLAGGLAGLDVPVDATTAINTAWRAAGGASGPLGVRQGDQFAVGDGGTGQNFAGGKIYYSAATGANAVSGDIMAKYDALGGPTGALGFPTSAEIDGGVPGSRVETFGGADQPLIFWTPDHGAVVVRGAMNAAWAKLGGATGQLGVPLSDQAVDGDNITQKFSGGEIAWDKAKNSFATKPPELAQQLQGLEVPGANAPTPPSAPAPEVKSDNKGLFDGLDFKTSWLWWIVPLAVLVLASLAVAVWLWLRRRGHHDDQDYDDDDDVFSRIPPSTGYARTPDDENQWGPDSDPRVSRVRFADHDDDYESARQGWSDQQSSAAQSRWSQLPDSAGPLTLAQRGSDSGGFEADHQSSGAHDAYEPVDLEEFDADDLDTIDTAPNRVHAEDDEFDDYDDDEDDDDHSGRHSALGAETGPSVWTAPDDIPGTPSQNPLFAPVYGAAPPPVERTRAPWEPREVAPPEPPARHDEPEQPASNAAIHLPLEDPDEPPPGYPIKGNLREGLYHVPDSPSYRYAVAQIWFASEDLARASGLTRAD